MTGYYGYCPFEIRQDEHFGSGLLGLHVLVVVVFVLVVLVVVVVSWLWRLNWLCRELRSILFTSLGFLQVCYLRLTLQRLSIKMICIEQSVCVRFL